MIGTTVMKELLILTEGPSKKNVIQKKKRFLQVKVDEIGTKSDKGGETATKK